MEASEVIKKIQSAKSWKEVFTKKSNYKSEYKAYALLLHPDKCSIEDAEDAFKKVTEYRDYIENSYTFKDGAGVTIKYSSREIISEGDANLLKKSYENYNKLMSLKDASSQHFKKYLPSKAIYDGNKLTFCVDYNIVSLHELSTSFEHARWILSRMLEFSAWLDQVGFSHAGINPESMYVVPESHGLICGSFYHLTKIDTSLTDISAKYAHWYPSYVLDKKTDSKGRKISPKAQFNIDLELSKRTTIYLLGDKSGSGVSLKKDYNPDFINFLISTNGNSYETYKTYIDLIHKLYGKPKFHEFID